ncbi:hypothetical protein [uncultured Nocardioides sp.]|uniref:hypothetical protein n=1 Tax=uncultured Nocardioides sp. TaxID=198441 RepID=UPI0026375257|nr:hypothetical protein [uncultured Nocardioides sp.]
MSLSRVVLVAPVLGAALAVTAAGVAEADEQSQLVGLQQQDDSGSQQVGVLSTSRSGERRQSQLLGAQQSSARGQQQAGVGSQQSDGRGRGQRQLLGAQQQDASGDQQQAGVGQQQQGGHSQQQVGVLQQESRSRDHESSPGLRLDVAGLTVRAGR